MEKKIKNKKKGLGLGDIFLLLYGYYVCISRRFLAHVQGCEDG
jgi:hypothetical protein